MFASLYYNPKNAFENHREHRDKFIELKTFVFKEFFVFSI